MRFKWNKLDKFLNKVNSSTTDEDIEKFLNKIFNDIKLHRNEIKETVLHIISKRSCPETKLAIVLKYLMKKYPELINVTDAHCLTFLHTITDDKYSVYDQYILYDLIVFAIGCGFNVNAVDKHGDTILHNIIITCPNINLLNDIYYLLDKNGFNSYIKNIDDETVMDLLYDEKESGTINEHIYSDFEKKFNERTNNEFILKTQKSNKVNNYKNNELLERLKELDSIAFLMNNRAFNTSPSIGREKEVKDLMISLANKKKSVILVGESGVGKTTIIDELVYRIESDNVPEFLKNQKIIEINPTSLVAGTHYRGQFEEKVKKIIDFCIEENVILFIDEIHEIYGAGVSEGNETNDMAAMLKFYIDRQNLKVIGTTTKEEYDKYFSKDALKRRFEVINIKEPNDDILKKIIIKVFNDLTMEYNIESSIITDQVIDILIRLTSTKKHDDPVNNPDAVILIINKIFSYAYFNSRDYLIKEDIINAIESNDRIYPSIKCDYIKILNNLNLVKERKNEINSKVLVFPKYNK